MPEETLFLIKGNGNRQIALWDLQDVIIRSERSRSTTPTRAVRKNAASDKIKNSISAIRATITRYNSVPWRYMSDK